MRFPSLLPLVPLALAAHMEPLESRQYYPTHVDNCTQALTIAEEQENGAVPAQLAMNCLLQLPFDATRAKGFIAELRKYMEWHSTIETLKNPPSTYSSPAVDLLGSLDKISKTTYGSQYEFDIAVDNLIGSANDGHLYVSLCSKSLFFFDRGVNLVAVSQAR
jgi:hypothetical protein